MNEPKRLLQESYLTSRKSFIILKIHGKKTNIQRHYHITDSNCSTFEIQNNDQHHSPQKLVY